MGLRPCLGCATRPRCPTLVAKGRCSQCDEVRNRARHERIDADRGSRHERGYTNAWAAYSRRRLVEHPWCVGYPLGVHSEPTLAQCTDHVQSGRSRPDLFWDPANHQSLCHDCNKRKAIAEEQGFGRATA